MNDTMPQNSDDPLGAKHMSNASGQVAAEKTAPAELSRQELLGALDFEIAQRGSLATTYGITVWGTLGTVVALLWASLNEIVGKTINWPAVLFTLFAGKTFLGLIIYEATVKLGSLDPFQPKNGHRKTIRDLQLIPGLAPDLVIYSLIEAGGTFILLFYLVPYREDRAQDG